MMCLNKIIHPTYSIFDVFALNKNVTKAFSHFMIRVIIVDVLDEGHNTCNLINILWT